MRSLGRPRSLALPTRKLIWRMHANAGMGPHLIARELNKLGVRTASGAGQVWPMSVGHVIASAKRDLSAYQKRRTRGPLRVGALRNQPYA